MLGSKFPVPKFFAGDDSFGLVGQGMVTIIHGPTNVGKTYLSTQLAAMISTGGHWLGHPCTEARVLMLQGELPPGLYAKSRLRPIAERIGTGGNMSFYNWSFNLAASSRFKETFNDDSFGGFDDFEKMLEEHRPEVVFIDPLQSYHNLMEASNDQIRELLKRLKRVAISKNIGIAIVDHDRKAGGDGTNSLRGASAKSDLADTVIGISREEMRTFLYYDKVRYINRALPMPREIHMANQFFEVGPPDAPEEYGQSDDTA